MLAEGYSVFTAHSSPVLTSEYAAWISIDALLGAVLHNFRVKQGVSQKELGEQVDKGITWIVHVESGRYQCPFSALLAMCWKLDLPFVGFLRELEQAEEELRRDKVKVVLDVRDAEGAEYDKTQLLRG